MRLGQTVDVMFKGVIVEIDKYYAVVCVRGLESTVWREFLRVAEKRKINAHAEADKKKRASVPLAQRPTKKSEEAAAKGDRT